LKAATARPAAGSLAAQQRRFNTVRAEFDHERPHEALDQPPPASGYGPSPGPRSLHWRHRQADPPRSGRQCSKAAWPADVARMQARDEARFAGMTR
jgi:hypothetical protein